MKERERILSILSKTPSMTHDHPNFHHGRLKYYPPNSDPRVIVHSNQAPRHSVTPWLTASEFQDKSRVLHDKVQYIARLLMCSKRTLVCTGSSVASRPRTSRSRSVDTQWNISSGCEPQFTHLAVAALIQRGLVHNWVQLTTDGLAQKAGCPQMYVNDIHGSWYDPANPVVKNTGSIRGDLYERMLTDSLNTDLTLALGTSLSGTVCDIVVHSPSERSLSGSSLGSVIVNTQQTHLDGSATLRIFSSTDQVLRLLLASLHINLEPRVYPPLHYVVSHVCRVRYNKEGVKSEIKTIVLDLTPGQRVRLSATHNCLGCGQKRLRHILRPEPEVQTKGRVLSAVQRQRRPIGEGRIMRFSSVQSAWEMEIEGVKMLLGSWWMEAAIRGQVDILPLININHQEEAVADAINAPVVAANGDTGANQ